MSKNINELRYQACNLCDALHRNINDNFESVSFEIFDNGDVQAKVVLEERTENEEAYIDDMIAEFAALQETNCVRAAHIEVGKNMPPLKNVVYQKQ